MSSISMVEARMPPGFRFHPTDDELVLDYLSRRLSGRGGGTYSGVAVVDVDLNKCEPWDLPEVACVGGKEWYFFTLRDRKYATGQRMNRATVSGYWKATGKDRVVTRHDMVVGMRKTLVFYKGRAPKGKKTEWVMHEFRMEGQLVVDRPKFSPKEDWVLCRVFYRSRATTPRSASVEAGTLSNELGLLAAPPITPLIDAYIAFDRAPLTTVEGYDQVPYFSGLPKGSMTSGDMVGSDTCDKKTMRVVLSNNSKLEFSQHWSQEHGEGCMLENGMPQIWNPF